MKLTKTRLKQLIKEELKNTLLNEDSALQKAIPKERTQYLCIEWYDELDDREKARIDRAFQSSNAERTSTNSRNNYYSKYENCPHKPPKITVYTTKTPPKE